MSKVGVHEAERWLSIWPTFGHYMLNMPFLVAQPSLAVNAAPFLQKVKGRAYFVLNSLKLLILVKVYYLQARVLLLERCQDGRFCAAML
ncbi:hypothetical protein LOS15_06310 [Halomonas sp. 7T]|nr:hypothetical protein [Halomonas sp. 7T]UXZ55635.1 hypothetical protein LOS15_06310 [Halomonas sp. 7T]